MSWSVLRGKTRTRALARLLAQRNGILGAPDPSPTFMPTLFRKTNKLSHRTERRVLLNSEASVRKRGVRRRGLLVGYLVQEARSLSWHGREVVLSLGQFRRGEVSGNNRWRNAATRAGGFRTHVYSALATTGVFAGCCSRFSSDAQLLASWYSLTTPAGSSSAVGSAIFI